ncbi:MAG: signal peptidase II [Clostridiaceae bacterium]
MIYIIIIIGLVLDRITKIWAVNALMGQKDITIIKDFFDFSYLENRGAAFGIFQGKAYLLAAVTIVILFILFVNYLKTKNKTKIFTWSTGLIISGAVGNLIDRVSLGYVVDFVTLHFKNSYYFPSFNVADMCITFGTGLLILYIIKEAD